MISKSFNVLAPILMIVAVATGPLNAQEILHRPLATEPTPYTVDQAVLQLEAGILAVTQDRRMPDATNIKATTHDFGAVVFRYGLTSQTELQSIVLLHRHREVSSVDGSAWSDNGLGDLALRLKQNVWGNAGGRTALALIPYVTLPINNHEMSNDRVEGGMVAPFIVNLADGFDITSTGQYDILRNGADDGYHSEVGSVVTFNHPLFGPLAAFEEITYRHSFEREALDVATADAGLSFGVNDDTQIDVACNVGLTRSADDLAMSFVLTRRF